MIAYFLSPSSVPTGTHTDAFAFSYRVGSALLNGTSSVDTLIPGPGAYWLIHRMPLFSQSITPCQKWPFMHP
ncbi:hypothetical protein [Spirosoma spitsbergense]|uniref:hypothetical protein n=1 Tax=Spirosoma spitsbergense TaxID=431554 RepID=UPI00037D039D|nr:hypothetical protein [Spirosoma spitsbergense]